MKEKPVGFRANCQSPNIVPKPPKAPVKKEDYTSTRQALGVTPWHGKMFFREPAWKETSCPVCKKDFMTKQKYPKTFCSRLCARRGRKKLP